ncbi:cobalt transporter subunit CbtA (proposed) [Methylibium sp. T29-B]|nr:cobalt transporter subunit CbtA (proposed) [Methylibium sp. T29-B]
MLFTRLIWVALGAAILVGSVQTALQQWQAVPIILAAEVFEDQKAAQEAASAKQAAPAAVQAHAHSQAPGVAPHDHGDRASQEAAEWKPADGMERAAWTWAANVLHGFSMALLVFAVMSLWVWRRGTPARPVLLGLAVAAAGWLTFTCGLRWACAPRFRAWRRPRSTRGKAGGPWPRPAPRSPAR